MEKLFLRAASTMNYLFLRNVVGKTELDGILKEELSLFLEELSTLFNEIPQNFYDIVKSEMDEGDYIEGYSHSEFSDLTAKSISDIMGELDENVYNFYTYIAGEILEENK